MLLPMFVCVCVYTCMRACVGVCTCLSDGQRPFMLFSCLHSGAASRDKYSEGRNIEDRSSSSSPSQHLGTRFANTHPSTHTHKVQFKEGKIQLKSQYKFSNSTICGFKKMIVCIFFIDLTLVLRENGQVTHTQLLPCFIKPPDLRAHLYLFLSSLPLVRLIFTASLLFIHAFICF